MCIFLKRKGLKLVPLLNFPDFLKKIISDVINWTNFSIILPLLFQVSGNMFFVIFGAPVCDL